MIKQEIRLKLRSFDHKVLDKSVVYILKRLSRIQATFKGPIPIPNKINKFTVNKSTHVFKESREQFEIRHHSRLIIVYSSTQVLDMLMKLNIASGVDIQVKVNS